MHFSSDSVANRWRLALPRVLTKHLSRGLDRWLDRLTNVAIIVLAVAAFMSIYAPRRSPSRVLPTDYKAGDVVTTSKLGMTGPGLILITRSTCGVCTSSLPFYRTLDTRSVVAVADEPLEVNRQYLASNGVALSPTVTLNESGLNIVAVPTMIAVTGDGHVMKVWRGKLTLEQEQDVIETTKGLLK